MATDPRAETMKHYFPLDVRRALEIDRHRKTMKELDAEERTSRFASGHSGANPVARSRRLGAEENR